MRFGRLLETDKKEPNVIRDKFKLVRESDWGRLPLERDFYIGLAQESPRQATVH